MFRLYACVKQHDDNDCGAACLATVARSYRLKVDLATIRGYAGLGARGSTVVDLIQAAKQIGFEARGIRGGSDGLDRVMLPCIAHIVVGDLEHYVVIHRVTAKRVTIADPARGILRLRRKRFLQIWTGILIQLAPAAMAWTGDRHIGILQGFIRFLKRKLPLA